MNPENKLKPTFFILQVLKITSLGIHTSKNFANYVYCGIYLKFLKMIFKLLFCKLKYSVPDYILQTLLNTLNVTIKYFYSFSNINTFKIDSNKLNN